MASSTAAKGGVVPFTVPPLPYASDALEPHIDKLTMEIHHDKHHGAYVANLNKALESAPNLAGKTLEELLANNCAIVPENIRTAVRNNAGGHINHTMFWQIMAPQAGGGPFAIFVLCLLRSYTSVGNTTQQVYLIYGFLPVISAF